MRFFCCCQGTDRTACSNCAAGFGGQASCPAGTTCGTVPNGLGGTSIACVAPAGHPCCGTYKWAAAGNIQPLACQYDFAALGNPCFDNSRTSLVGVNRRKNVGGVGGPCEDFITVEPIPWDVTYAAAATPLGGGGCNVDGVFDPAPPAQPLVTVTVTGNVKTQVDVQFVWACQSITLTITGYWYVRMCSGATPSCVWHEYCRGIATAIYVRVPDSGECNVDGLYERSTCSYVHVPTPPSPHYRTLDDNDPPTYPVACPDCLEDGGPGCTGPGVNVIFTQAGAGCGSGGRCYRLHQQYSCELMPPSITVFLQ